MLLFIFIIKFLERIILKFLKNIFFVIGLLIKENSNKGIITKY